MAFTAKDVQALRERTNCGMMDCKKALTEADGDMDKAIEICTKANLTYGQYLTVRAQADTDGNGSVSQEEAKKAIDASGLSRKQKSAMWQSFNSKWKNNPYQ